MIQPSRCVRLDRPPRHHSQARTRLEAKSASGLAPHERQSFRLRNDPDRFDLVITDMTMPGLTGDDLAIQMLSLRPDLPVILCTGHSKRISESRARRLGIRAFVMKPLTHLELANTVRKVLDEA